MVRNYIKRGYPLGEKSPNAVTNEADVRLMRALHREGLTTAEIARKFEMKNGTVWAIVQNRSWRHVAE